MALKYDPLEDYLKKQTDNEVTLSFQKIELIIDAKLPSSACKHNAWWANDKTHAQAKAWLNAGFVVDELQQKIDGGSVIFRRK